MKILLKNATIVDRQSAHHLQKRDVLIENSTIVDIATTINATGKTKVVSLENLHISQGWFDSSVHFGEPGYEERETIVNGLHTAAKSGFTHVSLNANTLPVIDNKTAVHFIKTQAKNSPVHIVPIGALTMNCDSIDLAELYDMKNAGAASFYDYKKPVTNANLLKLALQYVQNFDGLVQSFPMDTAIAAKGIVNEHIQSTKLGLKGIPALAEELQITRDLHILEYTGGKLHIPTISTKKSVALIKEAKKKGLDVSCSVAAHNIILTDNKLDSFDTRYKVLPPLRTKEDTKALIKGLKDGTIDGVTSDHAPKDIELKKIEFDQASYGSIGLESCFGNLLATTDLETAIQSLTVLKQRFNIDNETIEKGNTVHLTLFNPDISWTFKEEHILSKSKNAALLGQPMKGQVYGIYSKGTLDLV